MKIVKVVELGDGVLEATFDDGAKAQYRKEDLEGESFNPAEFKSEVKKFVTVTDDAKAKDKGGKSK